MYFQGFQVIEMYYRYTAEVFLIVPTFIKLTIPQSLEKREHN
ncbi:hypothetical protein VIBR0546_10304 [Vibrio brasiliensis LMG 20546]|uniref:Uncharacterized protein n=1 Tax=Vibrio brasiliensis LMG 20546 TaxID=945543 RepID=E8LTZ0_9VIBR|nr:hypothetical protein VIBR0546_10304 [Vibrio brasiliensis LMG 20546]